MLSLPFSIANIIETGPERKESLRKRYGLPARAWNMAFAYTKRFISATRDLHKNRLRALCVFQREMRSYVDLVLAVTQKQVRAADHFTTKQTPQEKTRPSSIPQSQYRQTE